MRATWIIFQREVAQYFISPIAYLVTFGFLLTTALLFNADLAFAVVQRAADPAVIPSFLTAALVLVAPVLTMRLFAEETREGTLELLLTAPVDDSAIVLGKFLSAWFFFTALLLVAFIYNLILAMITPLDFGHAISAYLGIWLYGGATIAIGLLFSALTENQIIAAFLSAAALLLLYLGDLAGEIVASIDLARLLRTLSLQGHFSTSFAIGLVRAEDVAYFAGIIVVMLYITIRIVESHRWR